MNLRRKVLLIAVVILAALGLGVVLVGRYGPEPQLMGCGHPEQRSLATSIRVMLGGHVRHFCKSRDTVMRLRLLANNDFSLVENAVGDSPEGNHDYLLYGLKCFLQTNGGDWTVTVPQQSNKLAGNYLLTSAGRLHFHRTRPATTNDFVLQDWSR